MMSGEEKDEGQNVSYGWEVLTDAWFSMMSELDEIMCNAEDPRTRIEAAKALIEYFKSFGQSINDPWIPAAPIEHADGDDDDDDD